jgi:ABC-type spermidine/putrescine transport system permease subunit II
LSTYDPVLTRAARSLGASPLAAFRRVTLPVILPETEEAEQQIIPHRHDYDRHDHRRDQQGHHGAATGAFPIHTYSLRWFRDFFSNTRWIAALENSVVTAV